MKANLIQKSICEVIENQQYFWAHSNDITSPTHLNDIEEECYSQLCNLISDEDREEFEEKLKDLYRFIRKFDKIMKANVPEKIYLFENPISNEPDYRWLLKKSSDDDIEYIRTDAFIEKACSGIDKLLSDYIIRNFHFGDSYDIDRLINDFKNYMKGE